jgi:hypothetical protein
LLPLGGQRLLGAAAFSLVGPRCLPSRQILPLGSKIRYIRVPILPIIGKRQMETSLPDVRLAAGRQARKVSFDEFDIRTVANLRLLPN